MGNLNIVEEKAKNAEIINICKHWSNVKCDEISDESKVKKCREKREICDLYIAKVNEIKNKQDSCMSSAKQAPKYEERIKLIEECRREYEKSAILHINLYHKKLS
jgi:hypothetical protein